VNMRFALSTRFILFIYYVKIMIAMERLLFPFHIQIQSDGFFFKKVSASRGREVESVKSKRNNGVFPMNDRYLHCYSPCSQEKPDTPRFLVTLDVGIGDAVAVGLRAVDQIIENDSLATGTIDVLCNRIQAQIFEYDPRINRVITTSKVFFPGIHMTQWLRGITLDPEAARVVCFLRQRHYEAVFPSIIAPGLYFRLHSHIMYPSLFELIRSFLLLRRKGDVHVSTIVRHMVNRYFRKTAPQEKDISLYLSFRHVQNARQTLAAWKAEALLEERDGQVLMIAPDTASAVTRPPLDLLIAALSSVLAARTNLIVALLPSYTEETRSRRLWEVLRQSYSYRVFLIPAEPRSHLLETTALIDQADIFVTGDTGVMHLAAAHKKVSDRSGERFAPKNTGKIIALFGGTNPNYFGYRGRTTIIGQGRKEQTALRPGFSKESYNPKNRDLFDHISSQQIVDAILTP
jgi:ADP-heptose:LPS heptosyltransferase